MTPRDRGHERTVPWRDAGRRNIGYLSQVQSTLNYSRKLAALGRLMAGVAHEVKNPLNAMTIHLELLKQKLRGNRRAAAAGAAAMEPGSRIPATCSPWTSPKHVDIIRSEIRRLDDVRQRVPEVRTAG